MNKPSKPLFVSDIDYNIVIDVVEFLIDKHGWRWAEENLINLLNKPTDFEEYEWAMDGRCLDCGGGIVSTSDEKHDETYEWCSECGR